MSVSLNIESGTSGRLLHAATQLFWERSYAGVSVEDICVRAAVSKGSFHYFFSSKSALLIAALENERCRDRGILDQVFAAHFSPRARLQDLCRKGYEIQQGKRAECGRVCGWFSGTLGSELACRDEGARLEVAKTIDVIVDRIDRNIIHPMSASQPHPSRPRKLASMLFCYIQGCLMEARIHNDLRPVRDMARGIQAFSPVLFGPR